MTRLSKIYNQILLVATGEWIAVTPGNIGSKRKPALHGAKQLSERLKTRKLPFSGNSLGIGQCLLSLHF